MLHDAVVYLSVRRLDEAEGVHTSEAGKTTDKADVRAFWCFDRAHTAVVAEVHISYFEAGSFTAETTWAER